MESENENLRTAAQELLERDPKQAARIIVDAEISRHVAAAVAAERDRCLKLADECGAFGIADRIGRGVTAIDRDGIVERIDRAAVLAEREACAKIAEEVAAEVDAVMSEIVNDESWGWAMDEMSEDVNARWSAASRKWRTIAAKIRGRK
jgi:hypothetical protein